MTGSAVLVPIALCGLSFAYLLNKARAILSPRTGLQLVTVQPIVWTVEEIVMAGLGRFEISE